MNVLIPARGGSKGILRKNLRLVNGRPLVAHAVAAASETALPHSVWVSTDDPEIAAVARLLGVQVEHRAAQLADDQATVDDVVADFRLRHDGPLLVIQPTVLVAPSVLQSLMESDGREARVAAVPMPHLLWTSYSMPLNPRVNRQQSTAIWQEVGVRFYPAGWNGVYRPVFISQPTIDIDTPGDLAAVRVAEHRRKVCFWTAGNGWRGSGHIYRTLALANELQHHEVTFCLWGSDRWAYEQVLRAGFPLVPSSYQADVLVIDLLDTNLFRPFLPTGVPRLHLEDLDETRELTINALYNPAHLRYTDLRPEFTVVPPYEPSGEGRVLVTFGGTDPGRFTEYVASRLGGPVEVIAPPNRSCDLGTWTRTVAEGMAWADVVVTSGGRTVLEAFACRRPVVVACQNERETRHAHLDSSFGVTNCGLDVTAVPGRVDALRRDQDALRILSDLAPRLDGRGVERLALLVEGLLL